jgi:hypothetical protein
LARRRRYASSAIQDVTTFWKAASFMKRTKMSSFWSMRSTKSRSSTFLKSSSNLSPGFTAAARRRPSSPIAASTIWSKKS